MKKVCLKTLLFILLSTLTLNSFSQSIQARGLYVDRFLTFYNGSCSGMLSRRIQSLQRFQLVSATFPEQDVCGRNDAETDRALRR